MAALAGAALCALGCCCVLRCCRRVREGRGGGSLPSWLLPTPEPRPHRSRRSSPLGLRSKYSSKSPSSSAVQNIAPDEILLTVRQQLSVIRGVIAWHSGGVPTQETPFYGLHLYETASALRLCSAADDELNGGLKDAAGKERYRIIGAPSPIVTTLQQWQCMAPFQSMAFAVL